MDLRMAKLSLEGCPSKALTLGRSVVLALSCCISVAYAQETDEIVATDAEPVALGFKVVPRVLLKEAFTDNIGLTKTGAKSEQITEISPGFKITSDIGRLTGHLDYALRGIAYGQLTQANTFRNALDMLGKYEAVDGLLFLDFSGTVSQQTIGAFDAQSTSDTYSSVNKAQVSSYSISPNFRGRFGEVANYAARMSRLVTQSDSAVAPGNSTTRGSFNLDGRTSLQKLGWLAEYSRTGVDYSIGRYTEADISSIGLSYALTPQLSFVAKAGKESNNYTNPEKQTFATNDFGLSWFPNERSRISLSQGMRSFGDYHSVRIEQSTGLLTLRFTDTRDVSTTPTIEPSPVNGFTVSALSVQRKQDLQLSLRGVRDTLTFSATQSESARLDKLSIAFDDLARAPVHQFGSHLFYSHKLTPVFNLLLNYSLQRTWSDATVQENWLRELTLGITGRLTRSSALAIGLRHTGYTGATSYDENALTFSWIVEF